MSQPEPHRINTIYAFTDKALGELVAYLEQWFNPKISSGKLGGGTDPNAVHFNDANTELASRSLKVVANADIGGDDASIHLEAAGATGDFDLISKSLMTLTSGQSIQIEADSGDVILVASQDVNTVAGGNTLVRIGAGKVSTIENHSATTILKTTESTGVTSGIFDGGGP